LAELPFLAGERGRAPLLVTLFFISALVITAWGIWEGTIPADDQAVTAETAREVLETGDLLTMRFEGSPQLETPPLPPVIMAFFIKIMGAGDVAARLPFVIFSLAVLGCVFLAGADEPRAGTEYPDRITESGAVGLLSAIILLSSPVFARYSPRITFNIPFTFFVTAALTGWLRMSRGKDGLWLWGGGIAGGIASAGVGGLYPLAAAAIFSIFISSGRRSLREVSFYVVTAGAVAIGSIWLVPALVESGAFKQSAPPLAFGIGKIAASERWPSMFFKSAGDLWVGFLPWAIPATAAAVRVFISALRRKGDRTVNGTDTILIFFCIILFAILSVIEPAHSGIFLAVLPAGSILAAREMARWFGDLKRLWSFNQVMTAIFCLLVILLFSTPLTLHRRQVDPVEMMAGIRPKAVEEGRTVSSYRLDLDRYDRARFLYYGGWSPGEEIDSPVEFLKVLRTDPRRVFLAYEEGFEEISGAGFKICPNVIYREGKLVLFEFKPRGARR